MRVLVGVDGSPNSFAAVEFCGRLLSPERDDLVLLFASPTLSLEDELDPQIEQRARSVLSRTVLDAALEKLPEAWRQRAEPAEAKGSPGKALLDAIREHSAELVVVGFRGTSGLWEQFILGSVSRTIVQSATIPVLVVKQPAPGSQVSERRVASAAPRFGVLATYDGQPAADSITAQLAKFTWPETAEGWVLTAVRPMFPFDLPEWVTSLPRDEDVAAMASAWEQEHQQNLQEARAELHQFRDRLPPFFAGQEVIVVEGHPAEQIVSRLRTLQIDLVVMASRGRGRIERLLIGSTTEQVLASAPCSVLICR